MTAIASDFKALIGCVLDPHFRIDRFLGTSGMAAVFAGRDLLLERDVELSVVLPERMIHPDAEDLLFSQAALSARLEHPGFRTVHTVGIDKKGRFYLVQELLEGQTLRANLVDEPWTSPRRILERTEAIVDALAFAHGRGVVHRGVRPENIRLIRSDGRERVVLATFGFGRKLAEPDASGIVSRADLTEAMEYLAPEQAGAELDADTCTDVWSAGVVIYEMFVGQRPWEASTWSALMAAITSRPVPDVRVESRWRIPHDLAAVIHRALERDRTKRYADAEELRRALRLVDLKAASNQTWGERRPATEKELRRDGLRESECLNLRTALARRDVYARRVRVVKRWLSEAAAYDVPAEVVFAVRAAIEGDLRVHFFEQHPGAAQVIDPPLEYEPVLSAAGFQCVTGTWLWFSKHQSVDGSVARANPTRPVFVLRG